MGAAKWEMGHRDESREIRVGRWVTGDERWEMGWLRDNDWIQAWMRPSGFVVRV